MATTNSKGHRVGTIKHRTQVYNPKLKRFVKRDTETGHFIDQKSDSKPFKAIRTETGTLPFVIGVAMTVRNFLNNYIARHRPGH